MTISFREVPKTFLRFPIHGTPKFRTQNDTFLAIKHSFAILISNCGRHPSRDLLGTNLLTKIKGQHIDSGGSNVEALVEGEVESSVPYCNLTKTSLQPQLTKSSPKIITPHQRSSPPICQSCSKRMQ